MGANGGVPDPSIVTNWLTSLRAAVSTSTIIYLTVPIMGTAASQLTSAYNTYMASNPADRTYLINLGSISYTTTDGTHPDGPGQDIVANLMTNAIESFTAPSAPQSPSISPGNGSVTLSWTAPAQNGSSTILGYNIYNSPANTLATTTGTTTSVIISGLSSNTSYSYDITAFNALGESSSTSVVSTTTQAGVPVLNTLSATGLSTSTATLNAQILATGGANATQSGFAYGTSSSLATVIATTTLGAQTGTTTFSQSFTNLTPNLTYYFRAYAVNSAGTTTGSILSFNTNDVTPPVVILTTPTNGQIVAGSAVQLSATAYDDVGVVGVQFKVGANTNIGSLITSTSSPNTYTTTWDSTGITTYGSHTLYAVAHDAAGNYSTSTVSVTVDNVAPTILSAVYNSSTQITVTLSAAASTSTITKANNGGFTVTKTGSGTTYAVSAIAPGSSTTQVILTTADMTTAGGAGVVVTYASGGNGTIVDTLGNILATNNTGITVPPWNTTAPIISSITSNVANGAYTIGAPIDIDLTFSKNVNSTGSVLVTLNTGGTCSFTVTNSNTASCTYTVASGQNTAALNVASTSGTIISTDSNAMTSFAPALNLANNKSIDIDTIAPSVTLRSPTASSTVLGHSITFSATAADVGTGVAGVQFILDGTNVGSMILSAPYSETWDSTAVADGTHTLSAVAVDGAGNTATSTISFTTDNSTYTVGGTVSGLTGTVIVQNNATDTRSLSANGSFTFPTALADNSAYTVTVLTQPAGQTCSVTNSSGNVSGANVTSVTVSCANNAVASSPVVSFGGGGGGSASAASLATILAPSPAATAYINTLTTAPVPPPVSSITPVSAGAVGASVRSVQDFLVAQGLLNSADTTGFFGPLTKAAVIAFQIKHGIVASPTSPGAGIVGPKTTAAMNATMVNAVTPIAPAGTFTSSLSEGSTGSEVKALQEYLNTHGFVIAQTGSGSPGDESTYFGVLTEQALAKFQAVHDIPATGFFGPMTRNYVENH
jgi:peptidoglycan hydrolase-like protein with peptidoglycan-binding domain